MLDNKYLYVARVVHSTSTDGVGLRNALYVSGCDLQCPGCHNKDFWPIESGKRMTLEEVFDALNVDDFNISILGGEPTMQYEGVLELCKMIKSRTHKTIWLWSGRTYSQIKSKYGEILNYIDCLVDGPFQQDKYVPNLQWRGSTNQHVIKIDKDKHVILT